MKFILFQIPSQATTLLPLCFFAACITTFNGISSAGEHIILRAAGASQPSFFLPAQAVGALICFLYAPLVFEISPWANRNILQIEYQSREQLAQNTLINASEPTFIGAAEVYAQSAQGTNLRDISLFGENPNGERILIHGSTANFTMGTNGIALMMSDGQVLQSKNQTPQNIQHFQDILIDLAPLIQTDSRSPEKSNVRSRSLFDLYRTQNTSQWEVLENQKEAGRRFAYLCLLFAMPSWILFWQLLDQRNRGGKIRLTYLGPIMLVPVFIFLEAPANYAGQSLGILLTILALILMLGFVGPLYYLILGRHLQQRIAFA